MQLLKVERPQVVHTVHWAASNGDRSENGDYIYGKKRLREIDRRIRFLTKRLDNAEVVDPAAREATDQIFFGATVRYANGAGEEQEIAIVGIDEVDLPRGRISWISPIARALTKRARGTACSCAHRPVWRRWTCWKFATSRSTEASRNGTFCRPLTSGAA